MHFRVYPLRFSFAALGSIRFPAAKASNLLRGAFGEIFRRMACEPHCPGARECELRSTCPYARMFEPSALVAGPSGLADWPRPFVFRAAHLDGRTIAPNSPFYFDLNLFDMKSPAIAYLVLSFARLAQYGLGPGRGRAQLTDVYLLAENGRPAIRIYDGNSFLVEQAVSPLALSLDAGTAPIDRVTVQFVTPTELKSGQGLVTKPEFGILAGRIRDRLSTLRTLYDEGPLEIDFRGFALRAEKVRLIRYTLDHVDVLRSSSKTQRVHPIGGFVGEADYEGGLAEFVPYLRAAAWTGVGRQTVWGKGQLQVKTPVSRVSVDLSAESQRHYHRC